MASTAAQMTGIQTFLLKPFGAFLVCAETDFFAVFLLLLFCLGVTLEDMECSFFLRSLRFASHNILQFIMKSKLFIIKLHFRKAGYTDTVKGFWNITFRKVAAKQALL